MPLRPGETFGRYQLLEPLGRGAMGEVYSAYDTVLHRKVALKVLTLSSDPATFGSTPSSSNGAARILREARAAAGIAHPNAVSIYDVGEVDGVSFLAMELVAGRTLRTFIGAPSVPLARRIRWVTDVARALGAAHALGLVHRDIKPENVMVRDDGLVKVLDFGIARRAITKEEAAAAGPLDRAALEKLAISHGTLTAEGVVVGTPMYMAPEQMRGEALDGRTDQFAWGVLAHEVLTGRLPWDGEGVTILSQILSQEVGPLSDRSPEIPARVDAVIRKAMSKAPNHRFPAMEEIADELEPFAASAAGATGRPDRVAIAVRDPAFAATEQVPLSSRGALRESGARAQTARSPAGKGRSGSSGLVVTAIAVGIAAVAVWGTQLLSRPRVVRPAIPDAAVVADVPSQMSTNPDANAAYQAGLQALRDGSLAKVTKNLAHAVELDPLFGAAQLQLALSRLQVNGVAILTNVDLQGVHAAQSSLGTRDRLLLDAFELVAREPPELKASQRVLEAATSAYPTDGALPFHLAEVLFTAGDLAGAVKALDVSLARDPGFAFAWRTKAQVELSLDDSAEAYKMFGECLRVSPSSTTCLADLGLIQANEGRCDDYVRSARQLIALVPDASPPYRQLAQGLLGSGAPVEAVRTALAQYWDRQPAAGRPVAVALAEASLAIVAGDFAGAERRYQDADRLLDSAHEDLYAFTLAHDRVLVALETGHAAKVLAIADAYLRSSAGLSNRGNFSLTMNAAKLVAGGMAPATFSELRDKWLAENEGAPAPFRWIDAYAAAVQTPEDARAALSAKPNVHPFVNALYLKPSYGEPIGRTLAMAGQADEGISYLTRAAASCTILDGDQAIFATWASFDLGSALEARGDTAGACAAYARVLARWGTATPPSRTAARALARKRVLACAP